MNVNKDPTPEASQLLVIKQISDGLEDVAGAIQERVSRCEPESYLWTGNNMLEKWKVILKNKTYFEKMLKSVNQHKFHEVYNNDNKDGVSAKC